MAAWSRLSKCARRASRKSMPGWYAPHAKKPRDLAFRSGRPACQGQHGPAYAYNLKGPRAAKKRHRAGRNRVDAWSRRRRISLMRMSGETGKIPWLRGFPKRGVPKCVITALHNVKSRPAKVGDKLTTRDFGTGTRGFAASEDQDVAVCVLPGTELAFAGEVTRTPTSLWPWRDKVIKHHTPACSEL